MPLQKVKIPEGMELFGEGLILLIAGHEPLEDQSTNPDFFQLATSISWEYPEAIVQQTAGNS